MPYNLFTGFYNPFTNNFQERSRVLVYFRDYSGLKSASDSGAKSATDSGVK